MPLWLIRSHPPNGIGPRCSAIGPRAATGRNTSEPTIAIVPNNRNPNVAVSSRSVPNPNGAVFFAPRLAAIAIGAMMGRYRLMSITKPVAMSHGTASGAGLELLFRPYVTPKPSNAEPLFADAD